VASLIIRNVDYQLYKKLEATARFNGRSIEEQACVMLRNALEQNQSTGGLGTRIHERFRRFDGVELELPLR
jgi:plasmid stability protein